jgi:hypothetical protein
MFLVSARVTGLVLHQGPWGRQADKETAKETAKETVKETAQYQRVS